MKELEYIQRRLKCEKDNTNQFGKYKYRTCSDIIEAYKSLNLQGCELIMSDEIVECGGRVFVKAVVTIRNMAGECESAAAFAETGAMGGMSTPQTTGAASTYARKYALCGLFLIDDSADDPDSMAQPMTDSIAQPMTDSPKQQKKVSASRKKVSATKIPGLIKYANDNGMTMDDVDAAYDLTEDQRNEVYAQLIAR